MSRDFQRRQLTVHSHKTFATVGFLSAVLAVQMLAGTAMAGGSYEHTKRPTLAPLINEKLPNKIPDEYIVVFKPDTPPEVVQAAQKRVKQRDGTIKFIYTSAFIGFSAKLSQSALQALRAEPSVAFIESNQEGSPNFVQPPDPNSPPPTGLARTSKRLLPLPNPLIYTYSETGKGVHVYVIDTGIDDTHSELQDGMVSRVSGGINILNMSTAPSDIRDCAGHGTHMAGTIGGNNVGIAKGVTLHSVRATNCTSYNIAAYAAAVQWVMNNKIPPAVVNLSYSFVPPPPPNISALDLAVKSSVLAGITHVISAGDGNGADACIVASPASVNRNTPHPAIVVGEVDPNTDTRSLGSNIGTCLDLFAPGTQTLSAMPDNKNYPGCTQVSNTPGSRTQLCSGTSSAAAHVTGVVARILEAHKNDMSFTPIPTKVREAIQKADNVYDPMKAWAGVIAPPGAGSGPGVGSPNEMLHYGSRNNGIDDGDPHITTVNGIHYDFQDPGEFVALRDANGMEIQTRQTPVATAPWVSVNTAIAARVGKHRVTWQPGPKGLQLRVDGALTTIEVNGLDLGDGGRVMKSVDGDSLEIHFPDETALFVTSHWWESQSQSYLTVQVFNTPATEGIMGMVEPDSWLQPQFSDTWRVTDQTSLFDYAPSLSTKTFTLPSFPKENIPPVKPENEALAQRVCREITDAAIANQNMLADCLFDVAVTGDSIFAKSFRIDQRIQRGATNTTVSDDSDPTRVGEEVTFTATVTRHEPGKGIPTGRVTFLLDGKEVGKPVKLDSNGQAQWKTRRMMVGEHRVTARYVPDKDSVLLPSSSLDEHHTVEKRQILHGGAGLKKLYRK